MDFGDDVNSLAYGRDSIRVARRRILAQLFVELSVLLGFLFSNDVPPARKLGARLGGERQDPNTITGHKDHSDKRGVQPRVEVLGVEFLGQ